MKILSQFVEQFSKRHGRLPEVIEVSPLAMTILAARRSVAPRWGQLKVFCSEIDLTRLTNGDDARTLGVDVEVEDQARLVAFSLKG